MRLPYPLNRLFLGLGSCRGNLIVLCLGRRMAAAVRAAIAVLYLPECPPLPVRVQIENTGRCNLNCIMCARRFRPVAAGDMPDDLFERILEEARPLYVTINGDGEPLLDPGLWNKLAAAERRRCIVSMPTNATLLDEAAARRLADSGVELITISLDGATRETYEAIRRGARFDAVLENIRRLKEAVHARPGVRIDVLLVLQRENLYEFDAAWELECRLGLPLQITPVKYLEQETVSAACAAEEADLDRLRAILLPRIAAEGDADRRRFLQRWLSAAEKVCRPAPPGRVCLKPWTTTYITAGGDVYPCCLAVDAAGSLRLGNVREKSFREIWHGHEYVRFRRRMLEDRRSVPICAKCPAEDAGLRRRFIGWFRWLPNRLQRAWREDVEAAGDQ